MPAPSIGPDPAQRMVTLLSQAKQAGLEFEQAWQMAWDAMVSERAFPHRTIPRHQWRAALKACRAEFEAAFYGFETNYSRWHLTLLRAVDNSRFAGDEVVMAELVA